MSYITYKQPYITWSEPNWSNDQEIAMGEEIAKLGKSYFRKQFLQGLRNPQNITSQKVEDEAPLLWGPTSAGKWRFVIPRTPPPKVPAKTEEKNVGLFVSYIFLFCMIVLALIFGCMGSFLKEMPSILANAFGLGVIVICLYLVSRYLVIYRHDRWMTRCLRKYQESRQQNIRKNTTKETSETR